MADNTEAIKNEAGNGEQKKPLEPLPQTATKQYTWTGADGTKINYTATAEMIPVRANDGQLSATCSCSPRFPIRKTSRIVR